MILTITLNPSIDIRYNLAHFNLGEIHRALECEKTAGGKGLNVARVINKLGTDVLTTGFLGGKLGEDLAGKLNNQGIKNDFEKIQGETRNCINILYEQMSTEVLESGPVILEEEWENFKKKFKNLTEQYKFISASGSLPSGLKSSSYCELIKIAEENGCKFFLDISGQPLKESLAYPPYFIKPNLEELEKLTGKSLKNMDEIIAEAKKLNSSGVNIVAVILGAKGSLIATENKVFIAKIPKVEILNTVDCGDSFVAGFITGISKNMPLTEAFKLAIGCSISNALLPGTGSIDIDTVNELMKKIEITIKE